MSEPQASNVSPAGVKGDTAPEGTVRVAVPAEAVFVKAVCARVQWAGDAGFPWGRGGSSIGDQRCPRPL